MREQTIGDYVRARREQLGMTQSALADRAGISRARVAQIEGGRVTLPGADHRRRLADALGVSHLDILVAAGEITEDELAKIGTAGRVNHRADPVTDRLTHLVNSVNWERFPRAAAGFEEMMGELIERQHPPLRSAGGQGRG